MRYLPHTPEQIAEMLARIGVGSIDALFEPLPDAVRLRRPLDLEPALDETSLMRHLGEIAAKNRGAELTSFLGAGAYHHPIPAAVDQLLLRSEFYTAYTPYQPEVAQGTLQTIFEFQTLVSEILGLPVANASMYDGASATAEAVLMAKRLTRRSRVLVSEGVHPHYRETVMTYLQGVGDGRAAIGTLPLGADGCVDLAALEASDGADLAAVVVGYPNFHGCIADMRQIAKSAHDKGALLITTTGDPFAFAVLEPPGSIGADIAVAEGQPLGVPLQYGGPYVGLFACRDGRDYLQQLPGRIVGETVDKNGERGYVLTLSTREQHIRRERATSNICTNTGLMALAVTIRLSMLGKRGFIEVARQCLAKAEYLKAKIAKLRGYSLLYPTTPTFHEFAVSVRNQDADAVIRALEPKGFLAGLDMGRVDPRRKNELLVAVTEEHSRAALDAFATALDAI